jgi:3-polyprenyl-4-hydroxybenzoate decarboxylase
VRAVTHRRDPVYPATVVGIPPMEDKFLGDATQRMLGPLVKLVHPEIVRLWAYYEAGFHNLLVVSVDQRYAKESMKTALGLMGLSQLSLTKSVVMVSEGVDVTDFRAVLDAVRSHFDPHFDFILIPKVPLDTLDFTSFTMNLGSRMVIDATRKPDRPPRPRPERPCSAGMLEPLKQVHQSIRNIEVINDSLLVVQAAGEGRKVLEAVLRHPLAAGIPLLAVVSEDVNLRDQENLIWGIFTRFDCERDVLFTAQHMIGISPIYTGTMGIDATWKPGYPAPLRMPDEIKRKVDSRWGEYWQ